MRELKNELRRAFILADRGIEFDGLSTTTVPGPAPRSGSAEAPTVGGSLEDAERELILATLERCGGDKKQAVEILGISLKTLYNRLHLYART